MQTWSFFMRLYRFSPKQISFSCLMTMILSFFEGVSIVAIIPILSLTGLYSHGQSAAIVRWVNVIGMRDLTLGGALALFILLVTMTAFLKRKQIITNATIQQKFNTHLNRGLYQLLAATTWQFWLNKTRSDINHVINNEISRVSMGCYFLFQLITSSLILVIYFILSLCIAPVLTIMIIIGGSLLFVFMLSSVHKSRKAGMAISHYSRQQIFNLSEHLNGIKEVKAYGMEQAQLNYLISLRQEIEVGQLKFTLLQSKLDMSYTIVAAFFISAVFYVSIAWLHLPLESLALVVVIFARLWPRISSLQNSLHAVNLALPAFKSILALEQEAKANAQLIETMPNETKRVLTDSLENIQFENMSFAYTADTANILSEVNLTIKAGEFIGCVGSSGSGKSTLADLLMGLSTPLRGKILINGYDLQQVKAHYQQWISYVPQDIFLFNASIRENLLWAAPLASEYEIWEVLKLVQLEQLVLNLPERLDSVVGDRGISLSGGERQRLVLARALLRKPQLLILDEATSALDEQNEHLVQQALEKLHGKLTVFVIAHRLATLTNATKIIKLESGVIEVIRN